MKIVAMIPTYNESGNISKVIDKILSLPINADVLVVDDNSPDGTYSIVEKIGQNNPRVKLLLRKENKGRGWAGIDGFKKALELGADIIVEMDGDLSHDPKYIPLMLEKISGFDVAVGSRYVSGGKDENRSFIRQAISNFARNYLAFVLGVKVKDPTSGFRMFKRNVIEKIIPSLKARDPFIVSEVLYYLKKNKFSIVEVPIEFMARGEGESKLKSSTLLKYLFRVWGLKIGY